MTENDNIRHYIGDLETTEDIDVVFKHIYDLMLANGGEGSGLNADMLDGFHASDFAPITLKDELVNCIQSIEFQNERYTGTDVILKEVLANLVAVQRRNSDNTTYTTDVETFLQDLDERRMQIDEVLSSFESIRDLFEANNNQEALEHMITNNIKEVIEEGETLEYYLDSDSVNGLSFSLISQQDYDLLPNAVKEDPRNIFIINDNINDIDSEGYVPPSLLRASMNLEFRIRNMNIEYSIDNGQIWKIMLPLVGVETNKGVLYPDWFSAIRDVMTDEDLYNQEDYPFLLNTTDNLSALLSNKIKSIRFGQNNTVSPDSNGVADVETVLNRFLNNWLSSQYANIEENMNIPDVSGFEEAGNKVNEIQGLGNESKYPSTKAIVDYVSAQAELLRAEIEKKENASNLSWEAVPNFGFSFVKSTKTSGAPAPKTVTGNIYAYYNSMFTVLIFNMDYDTSNMNSTKDPYTIAKLTNINNYIPSAMKGDVIYAKTEVATKRGEGNDADKTLIKIRDINAYKGTGCHLRGYLLFPNINI